MPPPGIFWICQVTVQVSSGDRCTDLCVCVFVCQLSKISSLSYVCVCLSLCLTNCKFVCLSIMYLFDVLMKCCLSICVAVCLFVDLNYVSVCLSVFQSVYMQSAFLVLNLELIGFYSNLLSTICI